MSRHAGALIADALVTHGVRRVFAVPGESFLALLDGLYDTPIDTVVCRHEGGAAYMAEATGKLTGRPGVAIVTRGPGAANAFVAVHTAWQDAVPLVLFVGLVPVADRYRESFQEFDPSAWFGSQTKRVLIVEDPDRAGDVVAEAFHIAMSGRPGPVVIGLPEDVLAAETTATTPPPRSLTAGAVPAAHAQELADLIAQADRPVLYVGGQGWTPQASADLARFAERASVPVLQEWRSYDRLDPSSSANAGWVGYGSSQRARDLLHDADLLVCIGAVLGDVASDGYSLRQDADAHTILVGLDLEAHGHSGAVTQQLAASPAVIMEALSQTFSPAPDDARRSRLVTEHAAFLDESRSPSPAAAPSGAARMSTLIALLDTALPTDRIVTYGAGNHTSWAQKHLRPGLFPGLLSVRNGSMGYSVPAAVAAALEFPARSVVAIAGDGEFLMNGQELATAAQENAPILIVVMDNAGYGTIRSHQQRTYPGRPSGTRLANPDFAMIARGMGAHGEYVRSDEDIPDAVDRALQAIAAGQSALIHLVTDPSIETA